MRLTLLEAKAITSFQPTRKLLLAVFLIAILAVSALAAYIYTKDNSGQATATIKSEPYVGVAFCGNTTAEAKATIDRTKNYTNLFVLDIGRSTLSRNESAVYDICDYATSNGLNIIVNLGINSEYERDVTTWFWDANLTDMKANWTQRWGDKFLGMYYNDEVGGIQLDGSWAKFFNIAGDRLTNSDVPAIRSLEDIKNKAKVLSRH